MYRYFFLSFFFFFFLFFFWRILSRLYGHAGTAALLCHVCSHVRYVRLFAPRSSSLCAQLVSWLTDNPPEFFDSKFVAQDKGREGTNPFPDRLPTVESSVFSACTGG